jgi:hypothetical protein
MQDMWVDFAGLQRGFSCPSAPAVHPRFEAKENTADSPADLSLVLDDTDWLTNSAEPSAFISDKGGQTEFDRLNSKFENTLKIGR